MSYTESIDPESYHPSIIIEHKPPVWIRWCTHNDMMLEIKVASRATTYLLLELENPDCFQRVIRHIKLRMDGQDLINSSDSDGWAYCRDNTAHGWIR